MQKSKALRLGGFTASIVAAVAMIAVSVEATGAYFSNSKSGTISGSTAVLTVNTNGGSGTDGLDLAFTNMLPGVPQSVTANFSNSGTVPQDVWIVFPNASALSALNDLGTYGVVNVATNTDSSIFSSSNLNDHATCPPGAGPPPVCAALPNEIKLASNVAPGAGGNVTFTFNYASKLHGGATSAPFNSYPDPTATTHNAADGSGSGLPYQIVATQVGIAPGA